MTLRAPSDDPLVGLLDEHLNEEMITMASKTRVENKDGAPKPGTNGTPHVTSREAVLAGLNDDLAGEYQAVLMYTHFSARLTGPFRRDLRDLFQAEAADELRHAQFLADKICVLGGEPTTKPHPVPYASHPREMLEAALAAEKRAVAGYTERIRQADRFGDVGLRVSLENHVADETRHKEELERVLAGWNDLNLERARNEDRWQDDGGQQ